MPALLHEAIGPDERATGQVGDRRGVQRRQGTHVGALGEDPVADRHRRPLVEVSGARELQVRGGVARVGGVALQRATGLHGAPIELEGEHQVGEFRLAVGKPVVVGALALEVVELDGAHPVPGTRYRDDPRRRRGQELPQQQPGQGEMAEVVRAELAFEAVHRRLPWRSHHTCVVDQKVEAILLGTQPVGELAHRGKVAQI